MHVLAVVVVSGPHVLEPLAGAPPVVRSVRAALGVPGVARVAVLAPDALLGAVRAACAGEPVTVHRASSLHVHGGERPGAAAGDDPVTAGSADVILVLDAARPFVPADLGARVVGAVRAGHGAVVPVLPLSDTVKLTDAGRVTGSPDRAALRVVQTPQGFARSSPAALDAVLAAALDDPLRAWTGARIPVHTVPGDPLAFAVHDAWHRDLARATATATATVQEEP